MLAGQRGSSQPGSLGDVLSGIGSGRQGGGQGGAALLTALLPLVLMMLQRRGDAGARTGLGGLGGLLQQFQQAGLGQHADSWVSTGGNMPISIEELGQALGADRVSEIARQAGVSKEQASGGLAALLPELVNQLTPQGQVPDQAATDDALGDLRRSLGL